MKTMYSSFDIARKILQLAKSEGLNVDTMKLLKLVYITHGWHLGFTNKPLINDEIQAWKYGPVIPVLYDVIKRFGAGNVDGELIDLYADKELDPETSEFVENIWHVYKEMSGLELSARTHKDGSAWAKTYEEGILNMVIDDEEIKQHYKSMIEEANESILNKKVS